MSVPQKPFIEKATLAIILSLAAIIISGYVIYQNFGSSDSKVSVLENKLISLNNTFTQQTTAQVQLDRIIINTIVRNNSTMTNQTNLQENFDRQVLIWASQVNNQLAKVSPPSTGPPTKP